MKEKEETTYTTVEAIRMERRAERLDPTVAGLDRVLTVAALRREQLIPIWKNFIHWFSRCLFRFVYFDFVVSDSSVLTGYSTAKELRSPPCRDPWRHMDISTVVSTQQEQK